MNSFLLFDLFFWAYVGLLVVAAAFDVWKFTIPNWISVALVGLFALAVAAHPAVIDWPWHLAGFGLMLAVTLVAHGFRVLGGGDLKLAAAIGLWVGFDALLPLFIWIGLAGGVFALGLIVLRRLVDGLLVAQPFAETVTLPRLLLPGESIPYGVAIAVGGILVARNLPHLGLFV